MERRVKIRFDVHQPLKAKVLGDGLNTEDQEISGTLENISGSGLRIISEKPLPLGAAIQIDLPDSMVLAEVRYVGPHDPHSLTPEIPRYAIGLEMKEILNQMSQLATLIEGIKGQSRVTEPNFLSEPQNKNDILCLNE